MRQKIIGGTALATVAAGIYVSLPQDDVVDTSQIAGVTARTVPEKVEVIQAAPAVKESVDDNPVPDLPPEWPEIVGIFEEAGHYWVLFRLGQEAGSTTRGQLIGERFRVENVTSDSVVVLDVQRGERRVSQLGWQGVQP